MQTLGNKEISACRDLILVRVGYVSDTGHNRAAFDVRKYRERSNKCLNFLYQQAVVD